MTSINRFAYNDEDIEMIFQNNNQGYHQDSIQAIDGSPEIFKVDRINVGLGKLEKVPREIKGRSPLDPFLFQRKRPVRSIAIKEF